ncbi:VanZ family protein [Alkalibaculum sp. M08DMB]|uniref:VanZ family protein n=1 Tax=Alkalibaculum sporogenes TaxID=2655001 RepID=A0A6A7K4E5_9FIRM|nr:VanZ family protein [Alkalibaculum sporogenes]MPW24250.1 VanZ family protein [Alkalibaculum sporogenes]
MKQIENKKIVTNLLIFAGIVYVLLMLFIIIFKSLSSPLDLFTGNHPDYRSVNLIPFKDIWISTVSEGVNKSNIIGNIILFIPFSIFIRTIRTNMKNGLVKSIGIVFIVSIIIEIIQFVFSIGVSDINDVILNTFGGMVGSIIYSTLSKFIKKNTLKSFVAIVSSLIAFIMLILFILIFLAN